MNIQDFLMYNESVNENKNGYKNNFAHTRRINSGLISRLQFTTKILFVKYSMAIITY